MKWLSFSISFVCAALLSGCVVPPPPVPDEVVEREFGDVSATEALQKATKAVARARLENLQRYAPKYYAEAQRALDKAHAIQDKYGPANHILKYVYLVEQNLEKGWKTKALAEERLSDIFAQMDKLERRGVKESHYREYERLLDDANGLIQQLEKTNGKLPAGAAGKTFNQDKQQLLTKMQELEVAVVKHNVLSDSEKVLEDLQRFDGEELSPQTYNIAVQTHKRAVKTIETDVDDTDNIKEAGDAFRFAVYHAMQVLQEIEKLRKLDEKDYEEYVLGLEQKLIPISSALKHKDVRDRPLAQQARTLAGAVRDLASAKNRIENQLADLSNPDAKELAELREAKQKAAQTIGQQKQQISQLEAKITQLKKSSKPMEQKIWLLEKNIADLAKENKQLRNQRKELENRLAAGNKR